MALPRYLSRIDLKSITDRVGTLYPHPIFWRNMSFQVYTPYICNITNVQSVGNTTVITTDIDHTFVIGNQVGFSVPRDWGMRELSNLKGYVLSVTNNTLTVTIDSSYFNPFITPSPPDFIVIDPAQVFSTGDANSGYSAPGAVQPQYQSIPGSFQPIID